MQSSFFSKINYSACNEDSESERKALQLTPTDTVLCITGSGARPLDLLIDNPKKIISIDFNPTQNYLLALKIAAYQTLSYAEFTSFLGLEDTYSRQKLYQKVATQLAAEAKSYWDKNTELIESGILYTGTWERLLKCMANMAFFRKGKVKKLMQATSLDVQRDYWHSQWDTPVWRSFLKLLCNRFLWTRIIREPGALLIPPDFSMNNYMHARLNHLASHHLLRENHFANLLFYGRYQSDCQLPIHLRKEWFDTLRQRVQTIEIVTGSLVDELANEAWVNQLTAYSLSDFSSYANMEMYTTIWQRIADYSSPGARFCERQFLVKRNPETLHDAIQRNSLLEAILQQEDSSAIYSFCVGTIQSKNSIPEKTKTFPFQ